MADEVKISALPAVTVPALTDTLPVVNAGSTKKETLQQILTLFSQQGVSITATGGPAYQATLSNNKGLIYYPSTILAMTLTLPTNAVDNTLLAGYFIYVMNPPGNTENITIDASTDTVLGTATIFPGSIALIFKSIYGAPNTWIVCQMPMVWPLSFQFGGNGASNLSGAQTNLQIIGKQALSILGSLFPTITNPCTVVQIESTTHKNNTRGLSFAQSGLNYAEGRIPMPTNWNQGTFTFVIYWKAMTATTGVVRFTLDAVLRNASSASDLAFGTAVNIDTAPNGSAGALVITAESGALTPAGTPSNGSEIELRVYRNGGNSPDTMTDAAIITNISMFWTTNAGVVT